jgi:hypothetical protein
VRTEYRTESIETIKDILAITERFPKHRFHIFRNRSLALLDDPTTFDYDDWCAGKLVARDLNPTEQ